MKHDASSRRLNRRVSGALLALTCLTGLSSAAQGLITVAVVPQTTQGFIDTDAGIRDSIEDIKKLLKESGVRVVDKDATVTLVILGRETVMSGDASSVQVGNVRSTVGGQHPVIRSLIKVGTYEKPLVSELETVGSWRYAAKQVVKDLMVWIDANRDRLK